MRTLLLVTVLLCLAGCGGGTPTRAVTPISPTPVPTPVPAPVPAPPPQPPVPLCQTNNTATVAFRNDSRTTTQDVTWDGLKVATVTPGATSVVITAAAGVAHRWEVRVTNSTVLACQVGTPILSQCSSNVLTCAFP